MALQSMTAAAIGIAGGVAGGAGNVLALGVAIVAIAFLQLAGGEEAHGGGAAALQHLRLVIMVREAALPMAIHHLVDALRHSGIGQCTLARLLGQLLALAVRIARHAIRRALQAVALADR